MYHINLWRLIRKSKNHEGRGVHKAKVHSDDKLLQRAFRHCLTTVDRRIKCIDQSFIVMDPFAQILTPEGGSIVTPAVLSLPLLQPLCCSRQMRIFKHGPVVPLPRLVCMIDVERIA